MTQNRIDPRAIIVGDVRFGSGNIVEAGAVLVGPMTVGDGNYFGLNCVVGAPPQDDAVGQDLRRDGLTACSQGGLSIGNGNVFREFVTVHRGLTGGTNIGDGSYLMAYAHVAHDSTIGDRAKIVNGVQMGGYTWIGRNVYVGGTALLPPFTVVGAFSLVGMGSVVTMGAVLPGSVVHGSPARPIRPNSLMLERIGVADFSWWKELTEGNSEVEIPVELSADLAEFRSRVTTSARMRAEVTAWRAERMEQSESLRSTVR